ncbi:UNVERIFIED_CONTAM: RhtB (resistance to homoserine/threonine) family protein [Brevibacillus sp. OAP136]
MVHFSLFVLMATILVILPGPDTGLTTQNTIMHGKKGGFQTMLGISCGLVIHTAAAVLGLSAILVKSAVLFSIFKYVGAVYLLYLGIKSLWALKNKAAQEPDETGVHKHQGKSSFRQGFLTNLLNPKVAVFFLTFLPQFVDTHSNTLWQFLLMGVTYTAITIAWFVFYVLLINTLSVWMKKPAVQRAIQGVSGLVLVGFGIRLALEKRP